jgi:predicted GIY-YIG superfamily endonuclease
MNKNYSLYLLLNNYNNRSYLGITNINNLKNNIFLHNNLEKNNCNYTKKYKEQGIWRYYIIVKNLFKYEAINLERLLSNKMLGKKNLCVIERRKNKLVSLLSLFPDSDLIYYNNNDKIWINE